jgi:hypothetical protein
MPQIQDKFRGSRKIYSTGGNYWQKAAALGVSRVALWGRERRNTAARGGAFQKKRFPKIS